MKMERVRAVEDTVLFKTHTLTAAESGGVWLVGDAANARSSRRRTCNRVSY